METNNSTLPAEKKDTATVTGLDEPNFTPEFRVKANCFDPENTEQPKIGYITFSTDERNVTMPGSKVHSGRAIDADLAVHFIQNFFDYYTINVREPRMKAFEASKAINDSAAMEKLAAKDIHDKILDMTYGMTLERDLILKILSQPKCEGIRFYLCGRIIEDDDIHLSLVTVGVDCDGYDLRYNLTDTAKTGTATKDLSAPAAQSITTQSLTGEYLTPPPPYSLTSSVQNASNINASISAKDAKLAADLDERYVLLNLAKQRSNATKQPSPDAKKAADLALS
jgi:hypothetical protein